MPSRPPSVVRGQRVDQGALRPRARRGAPLERTARGALRSDARPDAAAAGVLLAFAYPDRIGQRRPGAGGRFLLRNGRGAAFPDAAAAGRCAPDRGRGAGRPGAREPDLSGGRAAGGGVGALLRGADGAEDVVAWDAAVGAVRARRRVRLGALVLRDAPLADVDSGAVSAQRMLGAIARGRAGPARRGRRPLAQLQRAPGLSPRPRRRWPDVPRRRARCDAAGNVAGPAPGRRTSPRRAAADRRWRILLATLAWERRAALEQLAPTHLAVPSGSRIPIDYADPAAPVLAVRLQEMFGLDGDAAHRRAGGCRSRCTCCRPAHRPVQVTRTWRASGAPATST